ncbi:MAG: gamma-glutamyltransferase [Gemmatimonadales bacterium]
MKSTVSSALLLVAMPLAMQAQNRETGKPFTTRSEVIAQHGMAATSQPLATQAAINILERGGTAVDAAIAANAVLGVVEPHMNGVGGDMFAMVYLADEDKLVGDLFAIVWAAKSRSLQGINASGRSPASLTADEFRRRGLEQIPTFGPMAVSVPGAVDGWYQLHKRFGKLPMAEILSPAIGYARDGFPVTEIIADQWLHGVELHHLRPGFADTFMPSGRAPRKGEIFRNPALASTLQEIATGGRDAFYNGDIARSIERYMKEVGGFLSYQDLVEHHSDWVDPVSTTYRGFTVWELPPNGQGIAALQMLNILEGYDLASMGFGSPEYLHLLTEAKKLAYEDRAKFYADPDFNDIPVARLISKEYAKQRRSLIDMNRAARKYEAGDPILGTGETIYLTVADRDGNMISLIQSNYFAFGSGMTPPDLGFALQNRGALFNLEPGHFNTYAPEKRPFHTIIPAFVTKDGDPWLSFGVMGGAMQPQGHVQILVNLIDFGMNLQEAGDAPRIRHSGSSQPTGHVMADGGTLYVEHGFSPETLRALVAMGHSVALQNGGFGGYQAIMYDSVNHVYYGASDPRKDGQAAGY